MIDLLDLQVMIQRWYLSRQYIVPHALPLENTELYSIHSVRNSTFQGFPKSRTEQVPLY
jgi:hypothetical protein